MTKKLEALKERGIIFNAEMVRAILDGRKTQTRRVMKVQPILNGNFYEVYGAGWSQGIKSVPAIPGHSLSSNCPFGKVGDRLWVRETWSLLGNEDGCAVDWHDNIVFDQKNAARIYRASCWQKPNNYGLWSIPDHDYEFEGRWKPSIHMPRWASRINLEITGVRIERLSDISEEDAGEEGYPADPYPYGGRMDKWLWFRELWDSIHPEQSFKHNPWVWVIEFKREEASND